MTVSIAVARTPREAGLVTELAAAERQLVVIDKEILGMRRTLRDISVGDSVSASHAVRRAELGQRVRAQLDWLEPMRAEMFATVERLEREMSGE